MVSSLEIACIQPQDMRISSTGADTIHAFWRQSSLRLKSIGFMPLNRDVFSQVIYAHPGLRCWWKGWFKAFLGYALSTLVSTMCVQPCRGLDQTKIKQKYPSIECCLNQWPSGLWDITMKEAQICCFFFFFLKNTTSTFQIPENEKGNRQEMFSFTSAIKLCSCRTNPYFQLLWKLPACHG